MFGVLFAILLAVPLGDPAKAPEEVSLSRRQYRALVAEFEQGRRDFLTAIRAAKTQAEADRVIAEKRPDEAIFIAKFFDLAEKEPTSPVAAEAATWILTHTPYAPDPKAVALIARHHVASDAIGPICQAIGFSTDTANGELLRQIFKDNPHRPIRAKACLGVAQHLLFVGNRPPRDAQTTDLSRGVSSQAEATALLKQAILEYGDVDLGTIRMKEMVEPMLADIAKFGIGEPAPELEGRDAEGQRFKLSDYRGKVVVLTFSGNWCGPCKAMYPIERELVGRLKGRAFALLSVSTNERVDTLRASIKDGEITWRCWWDGGLGGPICKAWNIQQYPSIYVLDAKGLIRYRGVQSYDLTKSVDLLMGELR